MLCEVSQNRVSGFSKYSHKVNARFERKVELLMGGTASAFGSTSEESFSSSSQSILEERGGEGGGRRRCVERVERATVLRGEFGSET